MSRLSLETPNKAQTVVEGLYQDLERRIAASPPGLCPVDISLGFLRLCHAQTCGKCSPCRIGLGQLAQLMDDVLSERATLETIDLIEQTARTIADTADCAIGYEAAGMVLRGVQGFRDDYEEHVLNNRCTSGLTQPVPCVALCPAHVDVPGYIALVRAGRYADAVRLIRKDNPFPTACAFVCEHPCEARCRRNMVDDAVNICGIKHFAVTHAGKVEPVANQPSTGKRVAIIGGGPCGLSCAFYLQLMGHQAVVYEQRPKLGGMLRYGIPRYRLPEEMLDQDIAVILSTGVEVHTGISVGTDIQISDIEQEYDAVLLCIGAHVDRKIGIPGETSNGVIAAVEMLRDMGEGNPPDFTGKRVCVIGGGNVSMDATRTAIRLGADSVTTVYRRRIDDMTALTEEIEEAAAEGATILPLQAPLRIEHDEAGNVTALITQPQQIGPVGSDGRPRPVRANKEESAIPCDIVIVAIGQGIDSRTFAEAGIAVNRERFAALPDSIVEGSTKIFAGGDAVTGPSTVIRAIAAGKVAAANIDSFLGYNHVIHAAVEDIPEAPLSPTAACGRVNLRTRPACDCIHNFDDIKEGMTEEEVLQEASRCLRCDHYGYGNFRGGRMRQW
ncbi:NAD(P)-binding protein [Butyricicoccus sp.]|uniref:NAD(P)-binding protein n=1 Tax=Butyricicoccus sp. TaxID=2049021 RepID=UPI003F154266